MSENASLPLLLTVDEVAKHLRCSAGQVYKMVADGRLKAMRLGGTPQGSLRIRRSVVDSYIEEQERLAAPPDAPETPEAA